MNMNDKKNAIKRLQAAARSIKFSSNLDLQE
jgi:hypothetical protein